MPTYATTRPRTDQDPAAEARRHTDDLMQRVEHRLGSFLAAERAETAAVDSRAADAVDSLTSLVLSGGKRVRPAFCLTGWLAAGGAPDDPGIVDAAAGLEMMHVSALIHDDVLDDSDQRRGSPTVHTVHTARHTERGWQGESRRFGEGVAILVGDLALVYADDLVSQGPAAARKEWQKLRSEVLVGQYLDVVAAAEFSADPRLSRLIAVIKSGRYTIHRPLVMGAKGAGRADLAPAFAEFGEAVGEAFQLRDDLLDIFGDSARTGKPTGLDISQHKMTLLLGWAMQRDEHIRSLITEPGHTTEEIGRRLVDTGVQGHVETYISSLVERGCEALADAPIDPVWRDVLRDMAVRAAFRDS